MRHALKPSVLPPDTPRPAQNCLKLVPKPPKKDTFRWQTLDKIVLRYEAQLETAGAAAGARLIGTDRERRFVISFFLADQTLAVFEPPQPNRWGAALVSAVLRQCEGGASAADERQLRDSNPAGASSPARLPSLQRPDGRQIPGARQGVQGRQQAGGWGGDGRRGEARGRVLPPSGCRAVCPVLTSVHRPTHPHRCRSGSQSATSMWAPPWTCTAAASASPEPTCSPSSTPLTRRQAAAAETRSPSEEQTSHGEYSSRDGWDVPQADAQWPRPAQLAAQGGCTSLFGSTRYCNRLQRLANDELVHVQ